MLNKEDVIWSCREVGTREENLSWQIARVYRCTRKYIGVRVPDKHEF